MNNDEHIKLINTYSGLAKLAAYGDVEQIKKFHDFAVHAHLYDPQFYLPKNFKLLEEMFKKGKDVVVDADKLQNLGDALIWSIYLVQCQIHYARDIETGELLTPPAKFTCPDNDLVEDFIEDHLMKYVNTEFLGTKLNNKVIDSVSEIWNHFRTTMATAQAKSKVLWRNGIECKKLFTDLGYGDKGYIYGERKEYKKSTLTKKEQEIMKYFMKRGDKDLELFMKDTDDNGFETTFKKWFSQKKFMATDIVMLILNKNIGLRSKAWKRFAAKLPSVHFDKMIEKYAQDKRGGDRRSAKFQQLQEL